MNIIEVIPISRTVGSDTLSYFTSKEVPIGAIIDVPLRNKTVNGIVVSIKNAEGMKGEIKSAGFTFKKIDKIKSTDFFSKEFMEMAKEIAEYYAASIGSVINALVPDYIFKNSGRLEIPKSDEQIKTETKPLTKEKYAVQGDDEERYGTWKSLIRQEFAKKKSILIF